MSGFRIRYKGIAMFLHLGSDFLVNIKDIIGIFDMDQTTIGNITKEFLNGSEQTGIIISVDDDLPKSFVIATVYQETRIYLTSISSTTLKKRTEHALLANESV